MITLFKVSIYLCIVWLTLLLMQSNLASAKVRHHKWDVSYIPWSPDGSQNLIMMAVNGTFPGPTLYAQAGDILHIELTNNLGTEGVVIHWHGISQRGSPWADGTAGVSQCPIMPGDTYLYRFHVDKPGTYFYHGHYGMQRSAGLYGSLIVDVADGEVEPFSYDGHFTLLLSDLWHRTYAQQEADLNAVPMVWIGEPQSLLINGRGQFNCSLAAGYNSSSIILPPCNITGGEQYAPDILHVEPNKTYRLRIASTTAMASLNVEIQGHMMTVVEVDGNYVQNFTVQNIDIYSGDSYSVLFTTNQNSSQNYWISVSVRGREPGTPQGLTILNYRPNSASILPVSPPPIPPAWNDFTYSKSFTDKILAREGSPQPPTTYDRRIVLLDTQNSYNGMSKWAINNISQTMPFTPYLGAIFYNITGAFDHRSPPDNFSADYNISAPPPYPNTTVSDRVYMLEYNTTIDVIIQNANGMNPNFSEIHPWHMHGHNFWVLGYGEKRFTDEEARNFNTINPPLRNTAVVYPFGWTALRFVANNPGAWGFHCHIEPHLHMGMGVVIAEGIDRLDSIPDEAMDCGLLRGRRKNTGRT